MDAESRAGVVQTHRAAIHSAKLSRMNGAKFERARKLLGIAVKLAGNEATNLRDEGRMKAHYGTTAQGTVDSRTPGGA